MSPANARTDDSGSDLFWAKVVRGPGNECWIWIGAVGPTGYGRMGRRANGKKRMVYPHRVSYEIAKGPIPTGLEIDHLCRNRACVNPSHLEAVTHRENTRRGGGIAGRGNWTHCQRGHAFTVYGAVRKNGTRRCDECARQRKKAVRAS